MRELDNRLMRHIDLLVERYPSLESAKNDIVAAYLCWRSPMRTVESFLWPAMVVLQQMRSISLVN